MQPGLVEAAPAAKIPLPAKEAHLQRARLVIRPAAVTLVVLLIRKARSPAAQAAAVEAHLVALAKQGLVAASMEQAQGLAQGAAAQEHPSESLGSMSKAQLQALEGPSLAKVLGKWAALQNLAKAQWPSQARRRVLVQIEASSEQG